MILILNKKLADKELYSKNIERLKEWIEFEKNRQDIKIEPGCKVDVLDINSQKWYKGEIIKRTNITPKEVNTTLFDDSKSSALLYIEYKIDGVKNVGYFKADSILIAPEGYFTNEPIEQIRPETQPGMRNFLTEDSPTRIIRMLSRLNHLLTLNPFESNSS